MSTLRRRIIRPVVETTAPNPHEQQIQKQRQRLEVERAALARWMAKLRRAFHIVEKLQRSAMRLEREINRLEGP